MAYLWEITLTQELSYTVSGRGQSTLAAFYQAISKWPADDTPPIFAQLLGTCALKIVRSRSLDYATVASKSGIYHIEMRKINRQRSK